MNSAISHCFKEAKQSLHLLKSSTITSDGIEDCIQGNVSQLIRTFTDRNGLVRCDRPPLKLGVGVI